jgi:hypothetical protein
MPGVVTHLHPSPARRAATARLPAPLIYVVRGRRGPGDRPALPSGHPESWGAITDGTVLDHAPYPFPIFLDLTR